MKFDNLTFCIFRLNLGQTLLYHENQTSSFQFIHAKVPILKFTDCSRFNGNIDCDICVNNTVGVKNTTLLRYYAEFDQEKGFDYEINKKLTE